MYDQYTSESWAFMAASHYMNKGWPITNPICFNETVCLNFYVFELIYYGFDGDYTPQFWIL